MESYMSTLEKISELQGRVLVLRSLALSQTSRTAMVTGGCPVHLAFYTSEYIIPSNINNGTGRLDHYAL